ncbi:ribulose-phosphate 3-epimerase [Pseudolactococcus insecticola]|uniref:Ribulose-phosphate 3-epimerase n=1 Tax=Pseudolactococcus insecticola TaxID=2709158 RepID=A0A6A0B8Z4_9LACT|nr:ribulose-phosphate 3-epimerase [Lactococcus insecticola]GFH40938.1 ribulose-phosphate 3-epimerase [Lactococcus insecticola]
MRSNTLKIAPSILSADFGNFERDVKRLEAAGADYIHVDIMDGHFVENISFGADVVKAIRPATKCLLDCHLMVENPEKYVSAFAQAGADSLSIHVEATSHIHGALQKIRAAGLRSSVVINPGTDVSSIKHVLGLVDMVLVMTVNPGFGGQKFLPECLEKVRELAEIREFRGLDFEIEVDGGVDDETIVACRAAGADVFVAGSYVFNGDVAENIATLREKLA